MTKEERRKQLNNAMFNLGAYIVTVDRPERKKVESNEVKK